jgi:hypothetical protein
MIEHNTKLKEEEEEITLSSSISSFVGQNFMRLST